MPAMPMFQFRSRVHVPAEELFAWHARRGAVERLLPPWLRARVIDRRGEIQDGGRVTLEIPWGRKPEPWVLVYTDFEKGRRFSQVLVNGPLELWAHTHLFIPRGPNACDVEDRVEYRLRGFASKLYQKRFHQRLHDVFQHRHRVLKDDLSRCRVHRRYGPQRVAISGASGVVGQALHHFLAAGGHRVEPLVRRKPRTPYEIQWNPARGELDTDALEGLDAVIHLSGARVSDSRWTPERKKEIFESRVNSTHLLCEALAAAEKRPRVLIAASAMGYYGNRGNELLVEESSGGEGFLAEVCRAWETATQPARVAGTRVVNLRLGLVLSGAGGSLPQIAAPFRMGLGGKLGNGTQYLSWIALEDVIGAIHHLLFTEGIDGPINTVAPESVTNAEFTQVLGRVMRRPTFMSVPAIVLKTLFGEMGQGLFLDSMRLSSTRLEQSGFRFLSADLEETLRRELGL